MEQQPATRKWLWILLVGLVIVLLLTVLVPKGIQLGQASNLNSDSGNTSPNQETLCEQRYQFATDLPEEKRKPFEEEYDACIAALTITPDSNLSKAISTSESKAPIKEDRPRRVAGAGLIIYGIQAVVSPEVFLQTNTWYEYKNERYLYVFGGSERIPAGSPDSSQGAILIDILDQYRRHTTEGGIYETPTKNGPVTIVDAQGEQLTLVAQDGTIFFFNVASRTFVNPSGLNPQKNFERLAGKGTLIENGGSPFSGGKYVFVNRWEKETNGRRTTVYVGEEKGSQGQGILLIANSIGEPKAQDPTEVMTFPVTSPTLRIFDVKENLITMVGRWGETYVYDLASRRFLSKAEINLLPTDPAVTAFEASLPVVTPLPTPTLISTPNGTPTAMPAYP